jgi:arylsulfatase A-like enzyme
MKFRIIIVSIIILAAIVAGILLYNPSSDKPYNVLLVSVDTLRPDRLGYVGHQRQTSPNIDKLAKEGLVFTNAYSQSGWTLPSMATILTGRYPKDHGATDFHWGMNKRLPTLASILREHGYDTRGYVSHLVLTPRYGLNKGFGKYDYSVLNYGNPHYVATSSQLTDLVLRDLRDIEEPFFFWVHYFDPHFEYLSHQHWAHFGNSPIDRYDQEIAFTDYHIGRILSYLRQLDLYDNTIIIFTSDHGEEFGEHGSKYHYTCYEEILRVPLIIKAPFLEPGISTTVAEQIDFLPTILAMLNIEPVKDYPGRNLLVETQDDSVVFIERDRPPGFKQRAVICGRHKLIRIEATDIEKIPPNSRATFSEVENVKPGIFMFDLSRDPNEQESIFSPGNGRAEKLLAILAAHFAGQKMPTQEIEIDEEMRRKLRSLGYIQ